MDKGTDLYGVTDIKETDTFRSVQLMSACTQKVNVHVLNINRNMSVGLHGIRMEQNMMFLRNLSHLFDRLDGSDFIIGRHHRNQNGIRADSLL